MSKVYFMSDTHFGHNNILKMRDCGVKTVEEHDELLLNNTLEVLTKTDTLYLLGDVCFDMKAFHNVEKLAESVANIHIILGNHDNEKGRKNLPTIEDYLKLGFKISGLVRYKDAWLSHAPIHTDELRGKFNIHGHVHDRNINDDRYFNVSMDNIGFAPVSYEHICEFVINVNSKKN